MRNHILSQFPKLAFFERILADAGVCDRLPPELSGLWRRTKVRTQYYHEPWYPHNYFNELRYTHNTLMNHDGMYVHNASIFMNWEIRLYFLDQLASLPDGCGMGPSALQRVPGNLEPTSRTLPAESVQIIHNSTSHRNNLLLVSQSYMYIYICIY